MSSKPSNPKDSVGIKKAPLSTIPGEVLMELGVAMMEGARKYGRHNYRAVGVQGSVYYDATIRHLISWWEGEDIDPDSGLSHITKALASLTVLRDSMINNNWNDDRPPKVESGWIEKLNEKAADLIEKYPDAVQAFTEKDLGFATGGLVNCENFITGSRISDFDDSEYAKHFNQEFAKLLKSCRERFIPKQDEP